MASEPEPQLVALEALEQQQKKRQDLVNQLAALDGEILNTLISVAIQGKTTQP